MKKKLSINVISILFVFNTLNASSQLVPVKYDTLTPKEVKSLTPLPEQTIELTYSQEKLGFLGKEKVVRKAFAQNNNLFQCQFFNIFSESEAQNAAKTAYDSESENIQSQNRGIWKATWRVLTLQRSAQLEPFRQMKLDELEDLFYAGLYALSDKTEEQNLVSDRTDSLKTKLSDDKQVYFEAVIKYLSDILSETLDNHRFARFSSLTAKKETIRSAFEHIVTFTPDSENDSVTAIVPIGTGNPTLEKFKGLFSTEEREKLQECSDTPVKEAALVRMSDMTKITAQRLVATEKKVKGLEEQVQSGIIEAQKAAKEFRQQLEKSKREKEQLEKKVEDLEEVSKKEQEHSQKQEARLKRMEDEQIKREAEARKRDEESKKEREEHKKQIQSLKEGQQQEKEEAKRREKEREEEAKRELAQLKEDQIKQQAKLKQEHAKELEQLKKEQEDAANAQRKQLEEQLKRLNERVNAEEIAREKKRVEEEEKRKLEGAFVASARREEGSFKLGSSWKYKGEIAKSGNEVRAEGKGEFKLGFLTISGVFSNNKLDLSNAIVKRPSFGVNFNVKGYFDMELIKNSTGLSKIDRKNNCLEVFMPNDCKYVFSENKIEYVDATGVISEFTTE